MDLQGMILVCVTRSPAFASGLIAQTFYIEGSGPLGQVPQTF